MKADSHTNDLLRSCSQEKEGELSVQVIGIELSTDGQKSSLSQVPQDNEL